MDSLILKKIITFFALSSVTLFLNYFNKHKVIYTVNLANSTTIVRLYSHSDSDELMLISSNESTPFKPILGETLYKGQCLNTKPTVFFNNEKVLNFKCNPNVDFEGIRKSSQGFNYIIQ